MLSHPLQSRQILGLYLYSSKKNVNISDVDVENIQKIANFYSF